MNELLYEDKNILVLNKPSGIPSCPLLKSETRTAVHLALQYFPSLHVIGNKPLEPGLLHRLDTGTSGILVFAKTQMEFERLKKAWKMGQVKKHYRAIAPHLNLKDESIQLPHLIHFNLGHDKKSKKKMKAQLDFQSSKNFERQIRGKSLIAKTWIHKIIKLDNQVSDYSIEIETGVMHQIRCHFAALQIPLLGDPVYKGHSSSRLWLHAWKIYLPQQNAKNLEIIAPMPIDWPQ